MSDCGDTVKVAGLQEGDEGVADPRTGQLSVPVEVMERLVSAIERIGDLLENQARQAPSAASATSSTSAVPGTSRTFPARPSSTPKPPENDGDSSRCGVCFMQCEEAWAFLDCGHYPYCAQCISNLELLKTSSFISCPACMSRVKKSLKVLIV